MPSGSVRRLEDLVRSLKSLVAKYEPSAGQNGDKSEDWRFSQADLLHVAEMFYAIRRDRSHHFANDGLFGEPGWDILLDLFIAQSHGKRVSVTSACIAPGVPQTTALRWIAALEQEGLVERKDDPADARRTWLRLSIKGAKAVRNTLQTAIKRLS